MNILVLGSGGRESAICKALSASRDAGLILAMPGNGGIEHSIPGSATDREAVYRACVEHKVDLCVVTPDDPLAIGMVDYLEARGIACFGPTQKATRIESSKIFSKSLMEKYGIPTARARAFDCLDEALAYVRTQCFPLVIKADGLALGKGVTIAGNLAQAEETLTAMMAQGRFADAGRRVLIEEFLTGPEISLLAFTDGKTIRPMLSSMDHKRVADGDRGANTGGMGTVAPNPYYTEAVAKECMERIFLPTIRAMEAEGCPFRGCLYFGLMLTGDGPKVIEYNARFGDPETQVVLPLFKGDLLSVMLATRNGNLDSVPFSFEEGAACCVVMASEGYPGSYEKGKRISFSEGITSSVYIAGATRKDGQLVTSGGRVLGVSAKAASLEEAIGKAYSDVERIHFDGAFCRHDIGQKALEAL